MRSSHLNPNRSGRPRAPQLSATPAIQRHTTHSTKLYTHPASRLSLSSTPARSRPTVTRRLPASTPPAAATGDGPLREPSHCIGSSFISGLGGANGKSGDDGSISRPGRLADATFVPCQEQQHAIDSVLRGKNIFLTGCAGTGKSATLREIQRRLQDDKYGGDTLEYGRRVAVVATTGLAATIIGGTTLHSLLALGRSEHYDDFERMTYKPEILGLLSELHTLILDEAGMTSAEMLQVLDTYITCGRKKAILWMKGELVEEQWKELQAAVDRPFGGLQVILSGDVFQLPPIERKHTNTTSASSVGVARRELKPRELPFLNRGFLFQSPVFQYGGFEVIELKEVFRQDDQQLVGLLSDIRNGSPVEAHAALDQLLRACSRELDITDGILPTRLHSRNVNVDSANKRELTKLPGDTEHYDAKNMALVTYEPPASVYEPLVTEQSDAQMTSADFDAWVHKVLHKAVSHSEAIAKLPPGAAARAQELHDAWAGEVQQHLMEEGRRAGGFFKECQAGDPVILKAGAQVMLVRNLDLGGKLVNGSRGVVVGFEQVGPQHPDMEEAERAARAMGVEHELEEWLSSHPLLPLVRFVGYDRPVVVPPAVFSSKVPGYGVCVRIQVPLRLAWAITVHKAQGMTLDKAEIYVDEFWGHGMLYTALGRVRSMAGMRLVGSSKREMNPWVMVWWEALRAGQHYVKPPPRPPGSPRSPPWCWMDPDQQLVSEGQSPQARKWLATGGEGWRQQEEEEQEEGVGVRPVAQAAVQSVEVVEGEVEEEVGKVEDVEKEVVVRKAEVAEGAGQDGLQQLDMGVEQAVEQHLASGAGAAAGYHRSFYGAPIVYDGPPPVPPNYIWPPLPPSPPQPPPQPPQQQQQQQLPQPQLVPDALAATRPAAQRLLQQASVVARAEAELARAIALLLGPKRAITKAALEEAVHHLMAVLRETVDVVREGEGQDGQGGDVGSGEG